ncbi:Activator of 90 kDa heat shock protein ATPase like protein 2 [Pteropus alecto]|uniref:Activator of 90 kDa heat shock protein ATPase like protein 2 n=1 Tax=Pteropus alecto TaxID=9402 RepID=L5KUN5_PTEAL|nr:Activator of 90 kDa heat shock protein ATPase like protein 2 [Pteropus alecto]
MPPLSPHPPTRAGPLPGSPSWPRGRNARRRLPVTPALEHRPPRAAGLGRSAGGALRGAVGGGFWHFLGAANGLILGSENGNVGDGAAPHPLPPSSPALREAVPQAQMAEWGQGDLRWVEEREDGANVNNWQWTERDAASWSKGKFCEFLVGIVVESEAGHCQISELKQLEGEAFYSNGKGKLIFFYEWNIKLGWKGNRGLRGQVNMSKKKGDGDILKDLMKAASTTKVRDVFGDYLKALKTGLVSSIIGCKDSHCGAAHDRLFDTAVEQLYNIFTVKDVK